MAQIILANGTAPSNPSAGNISIYSKTADKFLYYKDEAGVEHNITQGSASYTFDVAPATAATHAVQLQQLQTPTFTGLATTNGQIKFPATQNPSADVNTLDDYAEGTFTLTITGCATAPTANYRYVKAGKMVTITPASAQLLTATSTATTKTFTGMPAAIRPSADFYVLGNASDNGGAYNAVTWSINSNGTITLYSNISGNGFTASGTFGTFMNTFTYSI